MNDFSERLKAMREGRSAAGAQPPSLKDRLQQGAPPQIKNAPGDVKARIQAKFQKKTDAPAPILEPEPVAAEVPSQPNQPLPEFEMGALPEDAPKKKESTEIWSPEHGGVCTSCRTYNPPHVAFCGYCSYMLIRSDEAIEIVTSYPLTEIRGLVNAFVEKLAKLNIRTTQDMLRVGISRKNRAMLTKHTGMSERSLLRLVQQADMCRVPSMGPETAALLELLGINTLDDLLKNKPLELYNKIQHNKIKLNQTGIIFLPTKTKVQTWLEEAKALTPVKIQ